MVLIAGDFTYFYAYLCALWDTFFVYFATVAISYGCGLAHGIVGMLLLRYFQKKQNKPTNSDRDNDAPANAHAPGNELDARQADLPQMPVNQIDPPPMPRTDYIYQTIPSDISVGLGGSCHRYHNASRPCDTFSKYEKAPHNKTKWLTPCKHCFPEYYSR